MADYDHMTTGQIFVIYLSPQLQHPERRVGREGKLTQDSMHEVHSHIVTGACGVRQLLSRLEGRTDVLMHLRPIEFSSCPSLHVVARTSSSGRFRVRI